LDSPLNAVFACCFNETGANAKADRKAANFPDSLIRKPFSTGNIEKIEEFEKNKKNP
jgi:hypothetical protein